MVELMSRRRTMPTEVWPVRGLALTVGEGDGDNGGTLHNPGEGVPHEGEELEDGVGLLGLDLVGAEDAAAASALLLGETTLVALEEGPDILELDGLDVDLGLVVEVLGLELDGAHVNESMLGAALAVLLIDVAVLGQPSFPAEPPTCWRIDMGKEKV
ncbi:hypothetical protein L1887_52857 [Cichorium endivia]|nr:hypothetical protein L1887_52857 [Cichorium endivia]